ncbi:hypothetical protein [Mycolicibacterium pyrenivorans]|uniref:hypothetical protein n=1 Tax=Mycolicibacterium pyrenivorans TaxID=187102 RepID=UPI0021F28F72|nr:hypothetical protein [Mycolicibacterium pyrenivorans]MCV7153875.1 hypothetical protein [Mycolicibacterium pyrenivorans]
MIVWVIAGLLGLATGLRIGWALVNKQSLVSTAMILALGSLGLVAAFNWQPLTLLIDTLLRWPNISMGLSQVALIGCAAGSCVMITTVASSRPPPVVKKIAVAQYSVAAVIAVASLVVFFSAGQQPEMSPEEYLRRSLGSGVTSLPWLLPLLYVLLALSLVVWAGLRHSNRTRRGRALFVFTVGIVLIVLALAFFLLRAVGTSGLVGVGAAATLLGCAMLIVAAGSLLPSLEDWFGARHELRTIQPLLDELGRRHPDVGIGVRPRGPLVFRVAERMSLISDALFLEATAADGARHRVDAGGTATVRGRGDGGNRGNPGSRNDRGDLDGRRELAELEADVSPVEQAEVVARWISEGTDDAPEPRRTEFPGRAWLRQPATYSDREWILEIARQYRLALDARGGRGSRSR